MPVSLGMLSILLMLDICFIVNYFMVRAFRKWTDRVAQREAQAAAEAAELEEKKQSSDIITNHLNGFVEMFNDAFKDNQDFAFAWVFGTVKLDPLRVKRFPGWKPIPFNVGIWTTCVFVSLATIVLSPDLVTEQLGVSTATLDADLCVSDSYSAGVDELREKLMHTTNIENARLQYQLMLDLHGALVNDTSLYGVPPYQCPSTDEVSGYKEDWTSGQPFFPAYCEDALEAAIEAAQSRECIQEVCDCPAMPDSPLFEITGLAGQKYCGEVCIEVPYPCPQHTADEEEVLDDYRAHQFEFAEARRMNLTNSFPTSIPENIASPATKTAEKIMFQVEVASYLYIGYQCLSLFFPSPLILFRMPVWTGIKRLLFGVQKPYFICFVVAVWWGLEYFRGIWLSPDIRLFVNNLRAGDPCFVDVDYLLERQMVLNDICAEIMPMAPEFRSSALTVFDVLREVQLFVDSCNCPFPKEHVSQITQAFLSNATEIGFDVPIDLCDDGNGADCTIYAPHDNITFIGNSSICTNGTAARKLVLESAPDASTDWWDLWVASGFLALIVVKFAVANFGLSLMGLADPFMICAGEFLWVPTDMGMELKTDDGSRERVRFLEAFDERGRAFPTEMIAKWFNSKKRALYHIGLSKTLFWGIIVHLCMFNLFVAVQEEIEASSLEEIIQERESIVAGVCLGFAGLVIFLGCTIISKLSCLPQEQPGEHSTVPVDENGFNTDDDYSSAAHSSKKYGGRRSNGTNSSTMLSTGQVISNGEVRGQLERGQSQLLQDTIIQVDTFDSAGKFVPYG